MAPAPSEQRVPARRRRHDRLGGSRRRVDARVPPEPRSGQRLVEARMLGRLRRVHRHGDASGLRSPGRRQPAQRGGRTRRSGARASRAETVVTGRAVVLYGPPASGKDTLTSALMSTDPAFVLFRKLKAGGGRTTGYRMTDASALGDLRDRGLSLYENVRYGATYAVDRPDLDAGVQRGQPPVAHMGQVAGIHAVLGYPAMWLTVRLWCSRSTAAARLRARGGSDVAGRIAVWDETVEDLARG